MSDFIRINKFLAHATGLSRREVDQAILAGRVKVNDQTVAVGAHIRAGDNVSLDNRPVKPQKDYTYLLLNKPVGYVCSRRQQGEVPTIFKLLPPTLQKLKPTGRLDKDSSGLLLLTDDGDFAHRMTHPKFQKTKTYLVSLDRPLQPLHQQMIDDIGVNLEDGRSQIGLERLTDDNKKWRVTMSEGRNRQIRRTFAALGYEVRMLHRITFGNLSLGTLKPGEFVELDKKPNF